MNYFNLSEEVSIILILNLKERNGGHVPIILLVNYLTL